MFSCVTCTAKYTIEDVKKGNYFPSTGLCLECYRKRYSNRNLCFGKDELYDTRTLACGQECPDRRICRAFIKHKKEFIKGDKHGTRQRRS